MAISVAVVIACARDRPALLLLAGLTPLIAYPRWVCGVTANHFLAQMALPYLKLAEEASTMIGEIEGWRLGYVADTVSAVAKP